jgi:hypothetical protein
MYINLILNQSCEVSAIMILFLMMRKLNYRQKLCHIISKQCSGGWNPETTLTRICAIRYVHYLVVSSWPTSKGNKKLELKS